MSWAGPRPGRSAPPEAGRERWAPRLTPGTGAGLRGKASACGNKALSRESGTSARCAEVPWKGPGAGPVPSAVGVLAIPLSHTVNLRLRQVAKKHAQISTDRVLPLHRFPAACRRFVNIRRVEAIYGRFQVMRRQGCNPPLRHRLRIAAHARRTASRRGRLVSGFAVPRRSGPTSRPAWASARFVDV